LAAGVGSLYFFLSKEKVIDPEYVDQTSRFGEDILIEGVRHFELKGDSILWSVDAKEARFFQPKNIVQFDDITATFHQSEGGELTLFAKRGCYEINTRNMSAEGDVMGIGDQGYEFWTQNLTYEASTKEIYAPDKVTLKKDRLTIEGVGLKGSLDTKTIQILSSIKATCSF